MTLEEWYFDRNTSAKDLTEQQFYDLLSCLDFELKEVELENGVKVYHLVDLQEGNLANIEQDIFYAGHRCFSRTSTNEEKWLSVKDEIMSRPEVYLYDYFERDE